MFPWTVFGIVTIRFKPSTITIAHIWAATKVEESVEGDERVLVVELGHKSQDDFTFSVDGLGGPIKSTKLACQQTEATPSDCGLEPVFTVLNNYDGVISPKIQLETWQIGATVDLTFSSRISLQGTWGAELLSDDVEADENGQSSSSRQTVRFRLMPLARGLPPERKSSFGFEATPPFHHMPTIRCDLKHLLPPPPPPSPPSPSPPPPERMLVDTSECFLGGRMMFVKPPTQVGVPWRFDVTLVDWVPDVLLTLNFVGDAHLLAGHPLQIDSVEPADAVWQDAITKHSVTYRLRPVKGGDPGALHIVAYGLVSGLGQVQCCCGPPPPPPPSPPPSPAPRPPPSPWPRPPPPPPFNHLAEAQIRGAEANHDVIGQIPGTVVESSSGEVTQIVWLSVLALFALGYYLRKTLRNIREHLLFRRIQHDIRSRFHKTDPLQSANGASDDDPEGGRQDGGVAVRLSMMLPGGQTHKVSLDMQEVSTMRELQALVLDEWAQAGGDRRESLMMEHVDAKGHATKVTKLTTLATLKASTTLNLLPKNLRRASSTTAKSARYSRLRMEDEPSSSSSRRNHMLDAIAEME